MINYEDLRIAIVQQACKDYQTALVKRESAKCTAFEKWFKGEWGQMLCNDTGEQFIAECQRRAVITSRPNRLANRVYRRKRG